MKSNHPRVLSKHRIDISMEVLAPKASGRTQLQRVSPISSLRGDRTAAAKLGNK